MQQRHPLGDIIQELKDDIRSAGIKAQLECDETALPVAGLLREAESHDWFQNASRLFSQACPCGRPQNPSGIKRNDPRKLMVLFIYKRTHGREALRIHDLAGRRSSIAHGFSETLPAHATWAPAMRLAMQRVVMNRVVHFYPGDWSMGRERNE